MPPQPSNRRKRLFNIATLVFVAVLVFSVFMFVEIMKGNIAPQNCHMAGFENCRVDMFGRPR